MPRIIHTLAVTLLLLQCSAIARAERFLGLTPSDRMTSVHAKFPNATYLELKAVWLQPHQRLVQVIGSGIDGELTIELSHEVDSMAAHLRTVAQKQVNHVELSSIEVWVLREWPALLETLRESPPADPWKVQNIRWAPPTPVALKQAVVKYGKPDKDATDEQFRRVAVWSKRGVRAYVSSDETINLFVFEFTIGDQFCSTYWEQGANCDPMNPVASLPKVEQPLRSKSDAKEKSFQR